MYHRSNIVSNDIQVYLVTGGYDNGCCPVQYLSSTELLVDGAGAWSPAGELPVAMLGPRGVSLNNNIFMTGNIKVLSTKLQNLHNIHGLNNYLDRALFFSNYQHS